MIASRSVDALGEVEEALRATLSVDGRVDANDFAEACAVDVRHVRQIQDELLVALEYKAVDLVLENFVALAQRHLALEVQDDDIACGSFLNLHRSSESIGCVGKPRILARGQGSGRRLA